MSATSSSAKELRDFSLVLGGPLYQLYLRSRMARPNLDLAARRILFISLLAWLPLLILTALSGHALSGPIVPFLFDAEVHTRFLVAIGLLVGAEPIVHRRIQGIVQQFADRELVAPEDMPRFTGFVNSALSLRNSVILEILLLACAIASFWLWQQRFTLHVATWYAVPTETGIQFTPAGYWYAFVSLMVFRFLLYRWYFRLFIWFFFLWQIARHIPLRLNVLHPDKAGGLAFVSGSVFAFAPVLLAHTVVLSGSIVNRIWFEGATLPQFKLEIAFWMVFLLLLVFTPFFFFWIQLARVRRTGMREYGLLASRYVDDFRKKWIQAQEASAEPLIGSADIQSLADLANSYETARQMRLLPIGKATVLQLGILVALPFLPLTLTMLPLEELINRAVGMIF